MTSPITSLLHHTPPRLVVLDVLSSKTVSSLALHGGVPLSREVAGAIARKLPGLKHLSLSFDWEENDLPHGDPTSRDSIKNYFNGVLALLSLYGSRLESLEVTGGGVHEWPLQTLMAVGLCTQLTRLTLEAGRRDGGKGPAKGPYLGRWGAVLLAQVWWPCAGLLKHS